MGNNKKFWNFKAKDDKTGELTLYGEISDYSWWDDDVTPKQFKDDLDAMGDVDEINVYINSPGGDVFAGQTIYSMLKRHKAKVNIYVDGLAASIASLIAMAGDRVIMPANAMMMIHSPWTYASGNAKEFRKLADDLDKIRESMITAYESKSALTAEEITNIMDGDDGEGTWLSAEDCLEYGLIDEIEEAKQVAARIPEKYLALYKNIPEELKKPPEPDEGVKNSENDLKKQKMLLELEL